jgi:hypothetical protein
VVLGEVMTVLQDIVEVLRGIWVGMRGLGGAIDGCWAPAESDKDESEGEEVEEAELVEELVGLSREAAEYRAYWRSKHGREYQVMVPEKDGKNVEEQMEVERDKEKKKEKEKEKKKGGDKGDEMKVDGMMGSGAGFLLSGVTRFPRFSLCFIFSYPVDVICILSLQTHSGKGCWFSTSEDLDSDPKWKSAKVTSGEGRFIPI